MGDQITPLFNKFLETVMRTVNVAVSNGPMRSNLHNTLLPFNGAQGIEGPLRGFFEHPPSHIAAVNALDHTQFTGPILLPQGSFPIGDVLNVCSKLGPMHFGEVWLALVDVAEAANTKAINGAAARTYLRQQTSPLTAMVPSQEQLNGIMGSIMPMLGAFPNLRDSVMRIMQDRPSGAEPDLNTVVDQVQDILLGPMLHTGTCDVSQMCAHRT